jgi:hypothetical protein
MTTDVGQGLAHCVEGISLVGLDQILCCILEHGEDIGVHKLQVGQNVLS